MSQALLISTHTLGTTVTAILISASMAMIKLIFTLAAYTDFRLTVADISILVSFQHQFPASATQPLVHLMKS